MFGFFIKKSFFDGWDNFLSLVLGNIVYIALLLLALGSFYLFGDNAVFFYLTVVAFLLLVSLALGGTAEAVRNYSEYRSETWRPFLRGIRRNLRHSLFFFLVVLILLFMIFFTIPFYSSMSSVVGVILAVIMLWVLIFFIMALPYYFPLMTMLPGDGPIKTLKKAFIVSADNSGKSFLLLLHIVVDCIFSVITVGLVPGICGIMLSSADMMKLLMKKYDWLEANPDKSKKDINWDELLYEERESVGPRSLRSMIFPWK